MTGRSPIDESACKVYASLRVSRGEAKRTILERRRRFVAAALATLAAPVGCGPASTNGPQGSGPRAQAAQPSRHGSATGDGQPAGPTLDVPPAVPTASSASPALDTDADGVPDADDACPTVSGVAVADSTSNGCPPRPCLTIVSPSEIQINAKIYFAYGSDRVPPEARPVLDELGQVLADYPEMELEIVGHSDDTEPESLSTARAENVRREIVARGVAPTRLTTTGAGARQPAAPSRSASGREQNRRVEFIRRGATRPLDAP